MVEKLWKAVERKIAKLFGTERSPCSGMSGKMTASDTLHERLFIEVKYRAKNVVATWFKQAEQKGKKEGKLPVIVLHIKGTHTWLAICSLSDMPQVASYLDLEVLNDDQWPLG
jgi:hypothetical protein